jgi:hypothetical protein
MSDDNLDIPEFLRRPAVEVRAKASASDVERVVSGLAEMIVRMEREAFERWASGGEDCPEAVERKGDGYKLIQIQWFWAAWKARAALQRPCQGIAHPNCNYLAPCGSICNKCGQHV